jgi:hypothetical protein
MVDALRCLRQFGKTRFRDTLRAWNVRLHSKIYLCGLGILAQAHGGLDPRFRHAAADERGIAMLVGGAAAAWTKRTCNPNYTACMRRSRIAIETGDSEEVQ